MTSGASLQNFEQPTVKTSHMKTTSLPDANADQVEIGLTASIVALTRDEPVVLTVKSKNAQKDGPIDGLPSGPFSPLEHRTLEIGLRSWVSEQTGLSLGYVEQLYTFGDRSRHSQQFPTSPHVVSIGYLALTRIDATDELQSGNWRSWYHFFPWEDWRKGAPQILEATIIPRLKEWAGNGTSQDNMIRKQRVGICFGTDGATWDEEKVLERFELLYEAGLVEEARRDRQQNANGWGDVPKLGGAMHQDHRRILATAISRVRAKIKYRPVVFELMPNEFTLYELQKTVEAILGPHLHKQNFRRLVESAGLVEPTGEMKTRTGGRPAKLFRFRREVLLERPAPGVRVKPGRA